MKDFNVFSWKMSPTPNFSMIIGKYIYHLQVFDSLPVNLGTDNEHQQVGD